jgi:aminopeptidase N
MILDKASLDDNRFLTAGSVLRMMQVALGVSTWTKGLKYYLETNQYQAADSDDLYASLQRAVDEDYESDAPNVSKIMKTWENQAGYPTVMVMRNPNNRITFSQERFLYSSARGNSLWEIPINYVVASNPDFTEAKPDLWMNTRSRNVEAAVAPKTWTLNDWVIVNIQESSYYRVNYDNNLWELIIKQLHGNDFNKIHTLNRAQLVDDSLNLARGGQLQYKIAFDILQYLEMESDYPPWAAVS